MPPAARVTDMAKHDNPHCHSPHPPPPPAPMPHPPIPLQIIGPGAATVMINNLPAARVTDQTLPCLPPPCLVPGGPGMIALGSFTVLIENMPAARKDDLVMFSSCVAPVPSPTGKILPPCSPDVEIG